MAQLENYTEPNYSHLEGQLRRDLNSNRWQRPDIEPAEDDDLIIVDSGGRYYLDFAIDWFDGIINKAVERWQYFNPPANMPINNSTLSKTEKLLNEIRKEEQNMSKQESHKLDEELLNKINKLEEVYNFTSVLTLYGDGSGDLGFVDPNDPCISEDVFHFDNMEEFHQKVDRHIYRVKGPKQSYEDEYEDQLKLGDEDNIIDWDDHCRFEDNSLDLVGIFADYFYCPDFKYEAEVVDKLRQIEKIQPIKSRQVAATIFGLMNNVKLKEKVR